VDPHRFCVDLHSICTKDCGATGAKLLILLKAVTADCGAIGSKLLILLENCASVWFLEKTDRDASGRMVEPGRDDIPPAQAELVRGTRLSERLLSLMCLDRSFPI
jgi:hypothetical protein